MKLEKIYNEYVAWFYEKAKTANGVAELRARKAYEGWYNYSSPVVPYSFSIWRIKDSNAIDEEAMAQAGKVAHTRNVIKYNDMGKYINGDANQGEFNTEYHARFNETKEENNRRRAEDPEWQAHDHFTKEADRVVQSGPTLYEEWEKHNKPIKSQPTFVPSAEPKKQSLLEKFLKLFSREEVADMAQGQSFMDKLDPEERAEFEKFVGKGK